MKKIFILQLAITIFAVGFGYAQGTQFTKAQAITILKDDYLFQYFKNPEDTMVNINLFMDEVSKIVSVSNAKRNAIRAQILDQLSDMNVKKTDVNVQIDLLPLNKQDYIPALGLNVNDIIKGNFTTSEYSLIYNTLLNNRITASDAYHYLSKVYQLEPINNDRVFLIWGKQKIIIDLMFPYYGI